MPWFNRSPQALGVYALAALLAFVELSILWQTLHPQVSDDYRAYYITRTTTCLPQPVTAQYVLGTRVDFTSAGNIDAARELLPCGWERPNKDGRQSLGESARLQFAVGTPQDLVLTLELAGVDLNNAGDRQFSLSAGRQPLGEGTIGPTETASFTFAIPASAISNGRLDLQLDLPNAIIPREGVANTYWRSVKLIAATLMPR